MKTIPINILLLINTSCLLLIININLFVSGNKRSFDNISSKNRFHLIVKLNEQKISKNN